MFDCSCCSKAFKTVWGLHAHERYHKTPERCGSVTNHFDVDHYISWEEYNESSHEEVEGTFEEIGNRTFESMYGLLQEECCQYLETQKLTLSVDLVKALEAGFPMLLDRRRCVKGDIRLYFEIADFVNSVIRLSAPEADRLLKMMRKVSNMHGKEIPLPMRYSTIIDNILSKSNGIRCRVKRREFALSGEIFGPSILSRIPKQEGIVTDIVKVIGNV
jgi:hypothetical protein